MNIKNKLIAFICSFVIILGLIPTVAVQAAVKDFNIISETKVTVSDAKKWAKSKGATDTFISLADLYWKYAENCGDVNPAIAYVQAGKETGYGKFGGVLDESYKNPCGMKTSAGGGDYDPNAHKRFNSWDEGVQAHLDHLALYAGANGYPKEGTYDPRHFVTIKGLAKTVNSLGGRWAPSSTYGEEVGKLYMNLMDYSSVDYGNSDNTVNNNISNNDTSGKVEEDEIETNALPNPGIPESKPSAIKADEVIKQNSASDSDNKSEDDKPSITSTIGWKLENENWYYYKSDGTKAIDWIKPDSNWYYLREDGKMATGWLNYNGSWYYLDQNGIMSKGLKIIDNKWYLFNSSGIMSTGIQSSDNKLYYLDNSGELSTQEGWISVNNKWYYLEKNGQLKTGWLKENSSSYYLQGDGSMVTGLKKIDGKVYLFADGGQMTTGWSQINSNWYYFDSTGEMVTGWKLDNDKYYYLYDTGAMAKGWININGTWYHLDNNGAMTTGWIDSNGDSYYLDKSTGRLMTNTTVEGYTLGSDGKKKKASNQGTSNNNSSSNNVVITPGNNSSNNNSNTGKKTIVVDAGHDYGKDYGAEKTINGVTYSETVLNMEVAEKLRIELENRGYNVIMTRKAGERPSFASLNESLSYRATIANNANADLYISIHHNSAESTAANGVETLYSSRAQDDSFGGNTNAARIAESQRLAALINNNIVSKLNLTNRGAKDQNLYVCRNTNMPAVLVECGFITSPEEAARCADASSQQKLAEAIAEVVSQNY